MAIKILRRRWHKISLIALVVSAVIILVLALLINIYWSPILEKKVREVVLKSSDGLYRVDFSSAELHVLRGTLVLNNITLKPDTAVYDLEKKLHLAPNNLIELQVKKLTLSHIHPFTLYFHRRLEIGEIILKQPSLNVSYQLNHTRDTTVKDTRTAWQKISKTLHSIYVGQILLGDVKFRYEDHSGNKVAVSELKEMDLTARDLMIDSATQTDRSRSLYCRDIIVDVNNYTGKTPSGLYTYKVRSLKLSTLTSQLNITGLSLQPASTFFDKSPGERFNLRVDSVQLNRFDYLSYHKYRTFHVAEMVLNNGHAEISANPQNHQGPTLTDRVASFPNVVLRKLNADMQIDTIAVHHIDVFYTEYNKKARETGTVSFNNTSGTFLNITTNPAALLKNNITSIAVTSYFMNRARLNARFAFNLTDNDHAFSFKGHMGPMDLRSLNSAVKPFAMIKVNAGTLKQVDFNIKADQYRSTGQVTVLYNNLNVSILKADTVFNDLRKRPIASLYANLFILKHNNPDSPGEQPRSAHVTYIRTPETPFFKFVWQSLLTGIKPCAGYDKKMQDATVALVNQQKINKENRKLKKELRKERRAERRQKRAEKKAEVSAGDE